MAQGAGLGDGVVGINGGEVTLAAEFFLPEKMLPGVVDDELETLPLQIRPRTVLLVDRVEREQRIGQVLGLVH